MGARFIIGLGCLVEAGLDPGGRFLATCSESALHLWEMNGTLISMIPAAPGAPFTGLGWSPHGTMIALSDYLGRVLVVHAPDLSIIGKIGREHERFSGVAGMDEVHPWPLEWSPDGTLIALAWCDERAYLYDVSKQDLLMWVGSDDSWDEIESLDWSPTGDRIALGTAGSVSVFNISNTSGIWWDEERKLSYVNVSLFKIGGHEPEFSPNGTYLAVLAEDSINLHDGLDGSLLLRAQLPFRGEHLAWSSGGELLAVSGPDGEILIVDPFVNEVVVQAAAHESSIKSLSWEETRLASASRDGTVKTWVVDSLLGGLGLVRTFTGWGAGVRTALWYPDGEKIAVAQSREGSVRVYGQEGSEEFSIDLVGEELLGATVSPDGRMIAVLTEKGGVSVWDAQFGSMATLYEVVGVYSLVWNPVEAGIIALVGKGGIRVSDAMDPGRGALSSIDIDGYAICADWSPDGDLLAVGLTSGLEIWDPSRPALLARATTWRYPYAVAWSPDSTKLACLAGPDWRFDWETVPSQYSGIAEIGKVDVWEIQKTAPQWSLGLLSTSYIPRTGDVSLAWSLSWAPNSTMLCCGVSPSGLDSQSLETSGLPSMPCVIVWHLDQGAEAASGTGALQPSDLLLGPARWVSSVDWSPDGSMIVAGSNDGSVWVWQVGYPVGKQSDRVLGLLALLFLYCLRGHPQCRSGRGPRGRRDRPCPATEDLGQGTLSEGQQGDRPDSMALHEATVGWCRVGPVLP